METLYNVYFAGKIQDGQQLDAVRAKIAKLFNADEQTLAKLFSGKAQLLKRNCDKATAVKYKAAIEKAGAVPIVKAAQESATAATAPQASTPSKATNAPQTSAEKIAALAATANSGPSSAASTAASEIAPPHEEADGSSIVLAPEGTEVLRENERTPFVAKNVDTSALSVDEETQRLAPASPAAPEAPDTSHLDMGEVGEIIPILASNVTPISPNTDAISLSPEGADFSDCAAPEPDALNLDLSALDIAPEGSTVLEEQYRKQETVQAPSTDHLSLDQ